MSDPVATLTALAAWYREQGEDLICAEPRALADHIDGVIARCEVYAGGRYDKNPLLVEVVEWDVRELLAVAEALGLTTGRK
jgi:hypothetical protein